MINNQSNLRTICWDLTGSSYLSRDKKWKSDKVKAARAEVTRDVIQNYFSHLEKWVIVPLGCIYNFDETNVMDDSSKKQLSAEKG